VWFTKGETLARATVPAPKAGDAAGVEALLAWPRGGSVGTEVPAATRLLGLRVADGVATVDLTRAFASGGGSLSMRMRVAQVVYTLTELDDVDRVGFELDGAPATAIGGEGVLVDEPVGRADFEDLAG